MFFICQKKNYELFYEKFHIAKEENALVSHRCCKRSFPILGIR